MKMSPSCFDVYLVNQLICQTRGRFFQIFVAFSKKLNVNPIPTSQGQNQPLYQRHVTKFGWNRVKITELCSDSLNICCTSFLA